uniref:EF-hand domain-containing protein n=1 Tax=Noctiluca scintillans TaxID=2966 RepID=A0A7S1AFL6_NOCSC|mmetsp:Transcript_44196/g.117059  ORF Transcript_44196/g.117059 Transcript_44196/m.117059 type:complete len:187 (+) Transcript_44196:80-640(+)
MGNKICVPLADAFHFRNSLLKEDVIPIIKQWWEDGELCFGVEEFAFSFDVVVDIEQHFLVFDTDRNGKVDAHEVFMAYILLAAGDLELKVDTAFSVFAGKADSLNFDELVMLVEACLRGVRKVCKFDVEIPEDEVLFHCRSAFDLFQIPHTGRISRQQFSKWVLSEPYPRTFVQWVHMPQMLQEED